jgi:expansin (peptidoglycan-binding protein)
VFLFLFFDTGGGASVTVTVVDRCVGCALTELEFSPAAFGALTGGNLGLGRVKITWEWA